MPPQTLRKNLLPGSLRRHAAFWQALKTPQDLAVLLRNPAHKLQLHSLQPRYKQYKIPKAKGGFRLIEDPNPELKRILRKVNHYLQAHYFPIRPKAVHGFCISPKHSDDRNIMSNARRHLGQKCLCNVDLKDFFHFVSIEKVHHIFQQQFPWMEDELLDLLSRLCTRNGRLPMGAPTSPALSNYACLEMDAELQTLSRFAGWTYTRFADDLSFSGRKPVSEEDLPFIRSIIEKNGFQINPAKIKHFGPDEEKVVTGLYLRNGKVELPSDYLPRLKIEIERLRAVMLVEDRYRTGMSMRKLKRMQQEIQGKINFAGQVMGSSSPEVVAQEEQYDAALHAREDFESANWLDIPYGTW